MGSTNTELPLPEGGEILVVDDDRVFREMVARAFRARGYIVTAASTLAEALASASGRRPDYLLVDLRLGEDSGLDVLTQVRATVPNIRAVIHTGSRDPTVTAEALRRGALAVLHKPADVDEILRVFSAGRIHT